MDYEEHKCILSIPMLLSYLLGSISDSGKKKDLRDITSDVHHLATPVVILLYRQRYLHEIND